MVMVCSEVDRSGAMAGNGMNYWRIVEGVCPSKEELTTRAVESSCDCWLSRAKLSESGFWNLDKSGNAEVQRVSILYPPWCALEDPFLHLHCKTTAQPPQSTIPRNPTTPSKQVLWFDKCLSLLGLRILSPWL
jgi:hypothetical protein